MLIEFKNPIDSQERKDIAEWFAGTIGRGNQFGIPYMPNNGDDTFWTVDEGNDIKIKFFNHRRNELEVIHRYYDKDLTEGLALFFSARYKGCKVIYTATPEFTIYPYKVSGDTFISGKVIQGDDFWVFDDPTTGLVLEGLISGTDTLCDYITQNVYNAKKGFKLRFSSKPFDGNQMVGQWWKHGKDDCGLNIDGNWYRWNHVNSEIPRIMGWLCPALFKYYPKFPERLYISAEEKK
jgi:hypothetical protein